MRYGKIGLVLAVLACFGTHLVADDVDDEIQRLEKEKKRLELKKEVEGMWGNEAKKNNQKALEKKVSDAIEQSQKPRDPNDFSHKNGGFGGIGLGYLTGDFDVHKGNGSATSFIQKSNYDAGGFNISVMAGQAKYFTKMHGLRYYVDANIGFGGDSYDFSNTYEARDKSWIMFNIGGNLDYLIDFATVQMMNSGWNIGAFAGVNIGVGMNMPYTRYCTNSSGYCYSWEMKDGYHYTNSFFGTSYGFQFGLKVVEDKNNASGLEVGYKYRRFGGSAQAKDWWGDTTVNYDGGMIYAMYTYRM